LGKQNAIGHKVTVQNKEGWTYKEWKAKGEEGRQEEEGRKVEDKSEEGKQFTISNMEVTMSAIFYLNGQRCKN
jgi:hypothetical protein